MAVISMDANDRAGRRAPRRRTFHKWNAVASRGVANDKRPTEFGYALLALMNDVDFKSAQLARAADVSPSTVTRLIYGGVGRPDSDTLGRIARALVEAGPRVANPDQLIEDVHNKLLHAAGYRIGAAPPPVAAHPLVVELQQMIGDGTPLDEGDVRFLAEMVDRLVEPYRRKVRRRSA